MIQAACGALVSVSIFWWLFFSISDRVVAGAGKTVLTLVCAPLYRLQYCWTMCRSIVVDHIQSSPPASRTAIAYIYFDYKNKDAQSVLSVFSSLLRQILEGVSIIPKNLESHYDSLPPERKENSMSIDECFSFMQTVCKNLDRVFLIFDALDECPVYDDSHNEHRSKIITMIQRASRFATIFITSRPHINLTEELVDCACLEVRAKESDMRAYLEARIANHKILRRIIDQSPSLKSYLLDRICSKANGM